MTRAPNGTVLDDESPTTRDFKSQDFIPQWGKNELDRDRDTFTREEEIAADRIGMPNQ
jgi:hypothetical protein